MSEILITGLGIVTSLGGDLAANHQALLEGRSGIGHLEMFPSRYAGILPCAEIKMSDAALKHSLNANEKGTTRTMLLALKAMEEARLDAGLTGAILEDEGTALINATTVGGMCLTDELYQDANRLAAPSEYLGSYDCGSVAIYLQQRYRIGGIINTINTACSSSANAVGYGARLLKQGRARRVIAGGVDSLAKFTINGFNALHILSPDLCAPFDRNRQGLNLGEGAAYVVMERASDVPSGTKVYARFAGYGNANDAYHPSSLSATGDGPFSAMKEALKSARLEPNQIGFINAHGTATDNNDEVESRAMIRLFGDSVPPFASTKGFTGHTLGAAGAVEAVFSILGLSQGEAYPNLHFAQPIAETRLAPVQSLTKGTFGHIMSNSFGFGGNCTSLIFSKV